MRNQEGSPRHISTDWLGDTSNPVMTASGTAGHGAELAAYFDLSELGAVVVKSLSVDPWAGNPSPRVRGASSGMINSVGLKILESTAGYKRTSPPYVLLTRG